MMFALEIIGLVFILCLMEVTYPQFNAWFEDKKRKNTEHFEKELQKIRDKYKDFQ